MAAAQEVLNTNRRQSRQHISGSAEMTQCAQHFRTASRLPKWPLVYQVGAKIIAAAVWAHDDPAGVVRNLAMRIGDERAHEKRFPQAGHFQLARK